MKCCRCPLYHYWSNESDMGEECAIFGDGWDSPFQYEDKEGTTIGCYLDRHFIEKAEAERDEYYEVMAESIARDLGFTADTPQTDEPYEFEVKSWSDETVYGAKAVIDTPQTERSEADNTDCPWK